MSQFQQPIDDDQSEYFLNDPVIKRIGPISAADVRAKLKAGKISGETLAITLGMTEWKRLDDSLWVKVGLLMKDTDSYPSEPKKTHILETEEASNDSLKVSSPLPSQSGSSQIRTAEPTKISSDPLEEKGDFVVSNPSPTQSSSRQIRSSKTQGMEVEPVELKSDIVHSISTEEQQLYLLKIELGWWQKLLGEIQKQDLIEDLEDIAFLKEQEERIISLSRNLSVKGLMEGTAGDFIALEYYSFDKAAERVEEQVAGILQKLQGDEFITEFLNSANPVGKDWFQSHLNQVQAICEKFTLANSHRIVGNDNLDVWKLFGERYGEKEDLPLLRDLIMIGQKNILDLRVLEAVNSPVLQKLGKTIKALNQLVDENGIVSKDIESNFKHYKDLQGLTSSRVLNQLLMEMDTKLKEAKIIKTSPFEINSIQRDKITKEIERLQRLKSSHNPSQTHNKQSFQFILNQEIDKSLKAMNLSLTQVDRIIEQKNNEKREEKNQKLNVLNQEIIRLQTIIKGMEKTQFSKINIFTIIFTVTWVTVTVWALNIGTFKF